MFNAKLPSHLHTLPSLAHCQVFPLHCPYGPLLSVGFVLRNHRLSVNQWALARHIFHDLIVLSVIADCYLLEIIFPFGSHGILSANQEH